MCVWVCGGLDFLFGRVHETSCDSSDCVWVCEFLIVYGCVCVLGSTHQHFDVYGKLNVMCLAVSVCTSTSNTHTQLPNTHTYNYPTHTHDVYRELHVTRLAVSMCMFTTQHTHTTTQRTHTRTTTQHTHDVCSKLHVTRLAVSVCMFTT